jgi:glycosyltransferase involved in cell wall biosynthesis
VPPEDSQALAQAICDLARNPEQRRQMGSNGRQYIRANLSRERTAQRYLSVLEELLAFKNSTLHRARRDQAA